MSHISLTLCETEHGSFTFLSLTWSCINIQFKWNRFSLLEISPIPLSIFDLLLEVFHLFLLDHYVFALLFFFSIVIVRIILTLRIRLYCLFCKFTFATFFHSIQVDCHFSLFLVVLDLFVCSAHICFKPLFPHFLVVDKLLCQVLPFEATEVSEVPSIVVELIMSLLSSHQLIVQCKCGKFCVFLVFKLYPTFNEFHIATASLRLL